MCKRNLKPKEKTIKISENSVSFFFLENFWIYKLVWKWAFMSACEVSFIRVLSTLWRTEMITFLYIYLYRPKGVYINQDKSLLLLISMTLTKTEILFSWLEINYYAIAIVHTWAGSPEHVRTSAMAWWSLTHLGDGHASYTF